VIKKNYYIDNNHSYQENTQKIISISEQKFNHETSLL